MLVLSRKVDETIHIGEDIVIHVLKIGSQNRVTLGISAPTQTTILRGELLLKKLKKLEERGLQGENHLL